MPPRRRLVELVTLRLGGLDRAGRFETYREYRTTPGVVLASVEDALRFNLYHEGLHLGSVLALRKLVG